MSARREILARVRQGLAGGPDEALRHQRVADWLAAPSLGPQPAMRGDLVERFAQRARSLASSVERIDDLAGVAPAVAAWLQREGLGQAAVVAPECAALDWTGAGLQVAVRAAVDADRVGISGCFCAIAETGTLLLASTPDTPASISLLPETHIALVPVDRIVPTMEAAFALWRAERGELPRAFNFVSGPSRTGDIEQTIVLGAHGPCRVHLLLIGNPS